MESVLLRQLEEGPWPCRNPHQNIADLKAQLAANQAGVLELERLCLEQGEIEVKAYMGHIMDYAESRIRSVLGHLEPGAFAVTLDQGAKVSLALRFNRSQETCEIDFTGTSAVLDHNFNCPVAVVRAAVLYVFRTLVEEDIPLNEGCLRPLTLRIPRGSMLDPLRPAPVVAGNVETSTCIVNALYGALGLQASGQPTMNNLSFGNAQYQYYETLAGGSGAGRVLGRTGGPTSGFKGASAIQAQMTNSRLTDPEVLELRFPVRVLCHAIRRDSGGEGLWRGGDGAIRRLAFLAPMTLSLITNGRHVPAFGLCGGGVGALGENHLIRADGRRQRLAPVVELGVEPGDVIEILTPGGGGFGSAAQTEDVSGVHGSFS
jgi:5-oxoprolinase (ATP-hydrolysing)